MLQTLTRRTQLPLETWASRTIPNRVIQSSTNQYQQFLCRQCANVARRAVCLEEERLVPPPTMPSHIEQIETVPSAAPRRKARKPAKEIQHPLGLTERPDPHEVNRDYIGPPDELSNLRPIVRNIAKNETPLAAELRKKQQQVEEWNQDFWAKHNKRFYDEKQEFIELQKAADNAEISADNMSKFYKYFLDKNLKMHTMYNVSWYMKNMELLVLSFQVFIQKLYLKRKKPT